MWPWLLKTVVKTGGKLIQAAPGVYRRIGAARAQQREAVRTFLLKFMPNITEHGFARTCCWPNKNGELVATDQRAAAVLVSHTKQTLGVEDVQVQEIPLTLLTRANLMTDNTNVALFGGPSANDASFVALGFLGQDWDKSREENRYRLMPDAECPLWEGVLKYYSIASIKFSGKKAIKEFEERRKNGQQTPYVRDAKWGIASLWDGKEEVLIEEKGLESTLLITRMPHFFHPDSEEKSGPTLACLIVDGVHGKQTGAFRLLFNRAHIELLEEINATVAGYSVFQIPLTVKMNTSREPTGLELRRQRTPIHRLNPDTRIRCDVHQYVAGRLKSSPFVP